MSDPKNFADTAAVPASVSASAAAAEPVPTSSADPGTDDWLAAVDAVAEDDGYLERLGPKHYSFFAETGTTLLVTFERAETIRARDGNMPALWTLVREKGWSLLTIIAEGETFWRAPEVWGYFDRLTDDAFFEDFDQVVFYGAGPAGYAAASYLVAAPAARAVLVAPRATMDPAYAGWDHRHLAARRMDFTSRYGYAPDMTDGAEKVWLVHDPHHAMDAAHAALFRRPWVQPLLLRHTGEASERALMLTGLLDKLLIQAVEGRLTLRSFAKDWRRARRSYPAYLRNLSNLVAAADRPRLERMICHSVTRRVKAPRYARRLVELNARLDGPQAG